MKVVLATISGWDGVTYIGVFSDTLKAFNACKKYLWEQEGTVPLEINYESEEYITYNIKDSSDIVGLLTVEIDKPI